MSKEGILLQIVTPCEVGCLRWCEHPCAFTRCNNILASGWCRLQNQSPLNQSSSNFVSQVPDVSKDAERVVGRAPLLLLLVRNVSMAAEDGS